MAIPSLALLALSRAPAVAFLPAEQDIVELGVMAARQQVPQRARRFQPGVQARLAKQTAWTSFRHGVGAGWLYHRLS